MENFVLNLFSDQLSKIILNYNDAKMKINANFMSGKGSITNVRLNTTVINQILTQPPYGILPFIQLKHVTLSELRLEVTSYTNLKKAPVVLVIDTVFVEAEEMMDYFFDGRHSNDDSNGESSEQSANQTKPTPKRQQYGLLHRITDNLSVRINKIHVSFQPLGKFKTRRVGKWTPPGVEVELNGVEWISVTQHGEIGTPEQIWAHNELSAQQASMRRDAATTRGAVVNSRHHHRMYSIFKRLSFLGCVRLIDSKNLDSYKKKGQSTLISDCKVDMHVGYTRRLRDAAITDVDVDIMCYDVGIQLDLCSINSNDNGRNTSTGCSLESVIHLMSGLQHCMYKDRSFVDPLLPVDDPRDPSMLKGEMNDVSLITNANANGNDNIDVELGPDDFMPSVNIMDVDSGSSDSDEDEEPDEEHDMAFLAWKKEQGMDSAEQQDQGEVDSNKAQPECTSPNKDTNSSLNDAVHSTNLDNTKEEPQSKYERKRKAVIVLASGAQKFEKLSFSLTLRRVNAHLYLTRDFDCNRTHCLEMLTEGIMMECIWPKPNGEIGGSVQCSMRYLHLMESLYQGVKLEDASVIRYLPLVKIGSRLFNGHDLFPSSSYCKKKSPGSITENENDQDDDFFPMMEKRQVSWKWARPMITGPSALSLKSSVSFIDEMLALWSKTFVVHEASIGEIEVCVDSDPLSRLIRTISSVNWDERWLSGNWMDEISSDMVVNPGWTIQNHNLQPIPAWYGSASGKLSALSSELRNITARFGGVIVRLPHPTYSFPSCGMADVVCRISSATVLVTSQLPASFLSGRVTACDGESTRFPNDKDDLSCKVSHGSDSDAGTQFRMQITLADFSLQVVQMPTNNINYLIAPTKITAIMSLQHTNTANDTTKITQSILMSVSVPMLESQVVVETALSAACTMNYHMTGLMCALTDFSDANSINQIQKTADEVTSVVCVHVSEISFNLATNRTLDEVLFISRVHVRRVELGLESTSNTAGTGALCVHKCVIGGFSMQSISSDNRFTDIVTTGMETNVDQGTDGIAIMLRVCHSSGHIFPTTSTFSLDLASPLIITIDVDAMETFNDIVIRAFNTPVYFYSKSRVYPDDYESSTQPTMIALISLLFEPSASLDSSEPNSNTTVLTRILFNTMTVKIPRKADGSNANFLLMAEDVDVTVGSINHITAGSLLKHQCGHDNIIWEDIVGNITIGTFYAFKSRQSLVSLDSNCKEVVLIPEFSLDWSSTKGEEIVKELIDTSVTIAKLMSYLSMKIYFMIPTSTTSKSRLQSPDRDFHARIGHYHSTILRLLSSTEETIERLRLSLFSKERERLGMMAFTPSVCGWLRICEGTASFHRLFTTATLCRYWVALINSLLICYEYPGATPLLVLPISSESISLRVIAIPSAYSGTLSIVDTHLQQNGFALVDSISNTELFCVAANCDEFDVWVSTITNQLNQSSPTPDVASDQSIVESSRRIIPSPSEQETDSVRTTEEDVSNAVRVENENYLEEDMLNAILDGEQSHPMIAEEMKPTQYISENTNTDDIDTDCVDMDEIALKSESENPSDLFESSTRQPSTLHITQESQEVKTPTVTSNRDILKKSRFTASKFNSALKSAKSGVIAKGRQAVETNISNNNAIHKVDLGQKFSSLKGSAYKLSTAALKGVPDHPKVARNIGHRVDPFISAGLETLGSESQVLEFPKDLAQTNRQELMKKKLADFDQSVRKLKIDEKLNSISTAVRNVANEGHIVARQISNTGSISQLKNQQKPIKFDARETFASHSEQPVRVKSIKSGKPLIMHSDEYLYQKSRLLSKIDGTWVIEVEVHELCLDTLATAESPEQNHLEASTELNDKLLKLKFTSTEVGTRSTKTAFKSLSEILFFQVSLSNIFSSSSYSDYADEATYQEAIKGSPVFDRMSPLQRIRIFGTLLQGVLDASKFNSSNKKCMYQSHCEMIKLFFQTLVSSDMPHDAIEVTENFLDLSIGTFPVFETNHHNEARSVADAAKQAFEEVLHPRQLSSAQPQPTPHDNDLQSTSSLLGIMMESYSKAIQERDQALAKLSTSLILQDNMLIQSHSGNGTLATKSAAQHGSSDDQLQMLCKNLGQEIELRTAAEVEVQSLKDRLDLERALAAAKEVDLMAELDKYKNLLKK